MYQQENFSNSYNDAGRDEEINAQLNNVYQLYEHAINSADKKPEVLAEVVDLLRYSQDVCRARQDRLSRQFSTEKQTTLGQVINNVIGLKLPSRTIELTENMLIDEEAKIGGRMFREPGYSLFCCTDEFNFYYHNVNEGEITLHYDIKPYEGVFLISSNPVEKDRIIKGAEQENFINAVRIYHDNVMREMYSTGQKLGHISVGKATSSKSDSSIKKAA